ncbi:MAG TPA: hypothetical protein VGG28_22025 [Kofleriaceae bacterium]
MPRYAAIGTIVLAGCFGPKSHDCASDGMSWVCPQELACAAPPTYCANPLEVGACDNMPDGSPCRTDVVPDGVCVDNACQMCSVDIEGCRQIGWNPMTVPSASYAVVFAAGSGDAWAGGTTLVHYDGAHWEPDATFPALTGGATITSISGTSSAHLFVGTSTESVYHLVGGAWTTTTTVALTHAVWAAGDDEAFAVGLAGDVEHFTAGAWTQLTSTGTAATLAAVWGTSPTNVYAVGKTGAVIHYNGSTWSATSAGSGNLDAVWGSSASDLYVGGNTGIYHSPDGQTWTSQDADAVETIWGDGSTDVFAGGSAGILRSDGGGTWVSLVSPPMVSSIAGSGPADVFAANGAQVSHYTGLCWSNSMSPPNVDFASASAAGPNMLFAAADEGTLAQFDGAMWSTYQAGSDWIGVWARAADDAYAVGGNAASSTVEHWDGSAWTAQPQPAGLGLMAVGGDASTAYAAGEGLVQDDAGTWNQVFGANGNTLGSITAIWVAPDDTVFLGGGGLESYPTTASTTLAEGMWYGLWGVSSQDVYAVGNNGEIRHYDGTAWSTPMATGVTVTLHAVWGTSDDDVFAAGDSGTLLHLHAGLWSVVPPPSANAASYTALAGAGSTIYVLGKNATASRLIESAP